MIQRFSGRPGGPDPADDRQAAEVFRRFFHVLARLGPLARLLPEALEHKAEAPRAPRQGRRPWTRR